MNPLLFDNNVAPTGSPSTVPGLRPTWVVRVASSGLQRLEIRPCFSATPGSRRISPDFITVGGFEMTK
jgi:hypothetical protein